MRNQAQPCHSFVYELEFEMDAACSDVWRAFTVDLDPWWRSDCCALGAGSKMELEPVAGGTLIERNKNGSSILWYHVQMVVPGSQIHFVGHTGVDWGGPVTSMLTVTVEERGEGAVVKLRDALFGSVTGEGAELYRAGWKTIFGALKAHVESGAGGLGRP